MPAVRSAGAEETATDVARRSHDAANSPITCAFDVKRESDSTFGGVAGADPFVLVRLRVLLAAVVAVSRGRRDL
jgi:hypothetical protein